MTLRILISGNLGGTNVGDSFAHAARSLGMDVRVAELNRAFAGSKPWRVFCRYFLSRRPPSWRSYNRFVQAELTAFRPHLFLTTGVSPVSSESLACATAIQAKSVNYPTDDPWNPGHHSPRYLRTIPCYDVIYTPRQSNADDFRRAAAKRVEYLPFAYDSRFARPLPVPAGFDVPDVLFVGGADADRFSLLRPVVSSGLKLAIYGDYWGKNPAFQPFWRGLKGPDDICVATRATKINLCLVRRQNRDGHVMRSYEIPAIGGCILAEDTTEHRELYGDTAEYFANSSDIIVKAKYLRENEPLRKRLAVQANQRILNGKNTYSDRLQQIIGQVT